MGGQPPSQQGWPSDPDSRPVKIFAYEHITGGGCLDSPLPEALVPEALVMLRALVGDLVDIDATQVIGLRDHRLPSDSLPGNWRPVHSHAQWQASVDELVQASDATWPVAPETGGILEDISERVLRAARLLLGSRPEGVRAAASKLATAQSLQRAGVPVVPTFRPGRVPATGGGGWVVKPDDGCGCEDVRVFDHLGAALRWIDARAGAERYVLQPYTPGEPLSLSALAGDADVVLLSVNRQHIGLHEGSFVYHGSEVNAFPDAQGRLQRLAEQVVAAIPGTVGLLRRRSDSRRLRPGRCRGQPAADHFLRGSACCAGHQPGGNGARVVAQR